MDVLDRPCPRESLVSSSPLLVADEVSKSFGVTRGGDRVTFDGRDLGMLSDRERSRLRRDSFGFVFQLLAVLVGGMIVAVTASGLPMLFRLLRAQELRGE
jgi:predicted ABC-type transport system involved in lysophospholipase L1 biosynthesis ATPase subunit